jgi:hypothetical protein
VIKHDNNEVFINIIENMGRSMLTTEQNRASYFNTDDAQAENFEGFKIVNASLQERSTKKCRKTLYIVEIDEKYKLSSSSKSNKS